MRTLRDGFPWNEFITEEEANPSENSNCNVSLQIREDSVIRVSKLTEGILVGGHILVMIFSLCGNTAALIIVLKSKAPKLSTKYFLTWLAIGDLLMTLTAPSTEIGKLLNDYNAWIFGSLLCILIPTFQLIAATMSAICLMAVAVERNLLIVRAMNVNTTTLSRLWDKWICPLICVSIIAVPVACGLPNLWGYTHVSFLPIPSDGLPMSPNKTHCILRYHCLKSTFDHRNIIYYAVTGGTYFILLGCFLICYISIYNFVKKHGNFRKQQQQMKSSYYTSRRISSSTTTLAPSPPPVDIKLATAERHRKTLRLILGLILLHICCRLPNWLYLVVVNVIVPDMELELTRTMITIRECTHLLSAINSALNPFLYVIWNHSLRATADRQLHQGGERNTKHFCRWTTASRSCQKKLRQFFHSSCSCGRCRGWNMEENSYSGDFVVHLPWKTPKVYYISDTFDKGNQPETVPSVSTQRVCISDRSQL